MTATPDVLLIIAVMTAAAALCRLGGYWFMGLIPITPTVESGLKAIPLAVMIGIMVPPVMRGGIPEAAGVAITMAAVWLRANDLVAILLGLSTVAALRQIM
jgi:uncharacterized membrane protein